MKLTKLLPILLVFLILLPACNSPFVTETSPTITATQVLSTSTFTATATPPATKTAIPLATATRKLSTPELIEKAFNRGEITSEERLLYLTYAVYDPELLPSQFWGNRAWDATFVVHELHAAAIDPSILCSMSLNIRSEIQRLLNPHATCE